MKKEIIHDCLLPLTGVVNFRDMGGIETEDGRRVKKGILFRAAELTGLTPEDKQFLEPLQIKRVFDYRRQDEADRRPDPVIGLAINERVSVMKEENITTTMFTKDDGVNKEYYSQFTVERFMKIYSNMAIENASFKKLMTHIKSLNESLPLVHHCTGGRDRTGVGSMIILMTLGVSYENVLEDYLLSNQTLANYHHKIFEKASQFFTVPELNRFKDAFPLREDYLQAAMNAILNTYGNFDTYIYKEFGITEEVRRKIKNFCLE